jgi:hypothetical protein
LKLIGVLNVAFFIKAFNLGPVHCFLAYHGVQSPWLSKLIFQRLAMRGFELFLAQWALHKAEDYSFVTPPLSDLAQNAVQVEDVLALNLHTGCCAQTLAVTTNAIGINVVA